MIQYLYTPKIDWCLDLIMKIRSGCHKLKLSPEKKKKNPIYFRWNFFFLITYIKKFEDY